MPLYGTASRASPSGGVWKTAVVPAASAVEAGPPKLEFFVSGSDGKEDRPHGGGTYVCPSPGGYKLQQGRLQPFPNARAPPVMLVGCPSVNLFRFDSLLSTALSGDMLELCR